jgi:hypothetical protein
VSRIIAGWPALALLIAVKLLSGILEHRPAGDDPAAVPCPAADAGQDDFRDQDRPEPVSPVPARGRTAWISRPGPAMPAVTGRATAAGPGTDRPRPCTSTARLVPGTAAYIAAILPAARAARDELHLHGQPLSRDALATRLRQAGHQEVQRPPHPAPTRTAQRNSHHPLTRHAAARSQAARPAARGRARVRTPSRDIPQTSPGHPPPTTDGLRPAASWANRLVTWLPRAPQAAAAVSLAVQSRWPGRRAVPSPAGRCPGSP